jgi:hypothetical protein
MMTPVEERELEALLDTCVSGKSELNELNNRLTYNLSDLEEVLFLFE